MYFVRCGDTFFDLEKIKWVNFCTDTDEYDEGVALDVYFIGGKSTELEGREAKQLIECLYEISKNKDQK